MSSVEASPTTARSSSSSRASNSLESGRSGSTNVWWVDREKSGVPRGDNAHATLGFSGLAPLSPLASFLRYSIGCRIIAFESVTPSTV